MSSVETGQMSAVEIGQMSAAETGQMSAVETRQMSSVARASVLCQHTLLRSQKSPCSSLRSLNCGNVTMFKSQIGGPALNRRKWPEMVPGGRQVLRIGPRESPGHFLASGTGPAAQNS